MQSIINAAVINAEREKELKNMAQNYDDDMDGQPRIVIIGCGVPGITP